VWLWGICDIENPDDVRAGPDIESFINFVSREKSVTYFHNLAFDGSFIIDYLFRHGYTHRQGRDLIKGQFSTLISQMGKFYSITVRWFNGRTTEFRDSLKKLPMSVSKVAQAFKLPEGKGSINYMLDRPRGWVATPEERDYLRRDVSIVARALRLQIDEGMTRLTVGADSLAQYKQLTGLKNFTRIFPVLSESMDAEIRSAYRGGFTYVDPRHQNKLTGAGTCYDVNSLYPSVMYDRVLPYGDPLFAEGLPVATEEFPLFIVSITFIAKIKPNHIPCIQIKSSAFFMATEYQTNINEPVTLMCTNVDLALWREHYDMEILSYNGGWRFHGIVGVFKDYIDKWMEVKANSDGGLRAIAKLHLNSLYGKFATNPNVTGKIPVMEDDVIKLVTGEQETRNPVYTAMGVFITAYARDVTIRAAQEHYDTFIYADTDSLHLLDDSNPVRLTVHPSNLGEWKREYSFIDGMFVRAKCYTELVTIKPGLWGYQTHIAGLPDNISSRVTFADYVNGRTFDGKLLPKRVPGGIVLHDVKFTLNL